MCFVEIIIILIFFSLCLRTNKVLILSVVPEKETSKRFQELSINFQSSAF